MYISIPLFRVKYFSDENILDLVKEMFLMLAVNLFLSTF